MVIEKMIENDTTRGRGKHKPHKLIAALATFLVTGAVWYADTYHKDVILPDQRYLQSISMLKLTELNAKYGVSSVIDLYNNQSASELADYLNKKTTAPVHKVFRVLEANDQKTANELIVNMNNQMLVFGGLERTDLQIASEEYSQIEEVDFAEPNYIINLQTATNRANAQIRRRVSNQFISQTSRPPLPVQLANKKRFDQTGAGRIREIEFYVPDSGMSNTHPLVNTYAEMGSELVAGEFVQQLAGDGAPNDHGTHVIGIIASVIHEAQRLYRLPSTPSKIFAYRVFVNNSTTASKLINTLAAIENDAEAGIHAGKIVVINASWGSKNTVQSMQRIISRLQARSALFFSANGNTYSNGIYSNPQRGVVEAERIDFPANTTIGVASIDSHAANLSAFSNYLSGYQPQYATPGNAILSSAYNNPNSSMCQSFYCILSGTSQSTPALAAMTAFLMQAYPGISETEAMSNCSQPVNNIQELHEVHFDYCR